MLVSKTDTRGVITFANDAFAETSGYAMDELVGQPHKIVRHPLMPSWVFDGMWRRLKAGKPWRGIVLNRRKNGDHYWVDAFIVPIKRQGETVEFMSVRLAATPEQIAEAKNSFALAQSPLRGRLSPRRFLSVKRGVLTGVLFVMFSMLVAVGIGLHNLDKSAESFHELHAYRDILATVGDADRYASVAQNQLLVALRHAPKNARVTAEDAVEIPEHLAQVRKAQQQLLDRIARLGRQEAVRRYLAGDVEAGESLEETRRAAALLTAYLGAVERYSREGLTPAVQFIDQGQFDEGEETVVGAVGSLVATMHAHSEQLGRYFGESADRHSEEVDELIQTGALQMTGWMVFAMIVILLSSVWFFRDTMKPLRHAIEAMRRIASGDLSERLDIYGFGEPGEVVGELATMQIHLKVMLDEIRLDSANLHAQIGTLNQNVISVLNNTEDSHGQASQILMAMEETGADTTRLAVSAKSVLQHLQTLGVQSVDDTLLSLATEVAAMADLNDFAASEVRRMSQNIMAYLVDNRESVNQAWTAGQELEKTSRSLNELISRFE